MQTAGLVQRLTGISKASRNNVLPSRRLFGQASTPLSRQCIVPRVSAQEEDLQTKAEETTKKFGLEAGLWKVWTDKNADGKSKSDQAKDLLKRYGSAYLITSISFAIVSFAACYALVNAGVDVAGVLSKIGLQVTDTNEKVGTFAIAYAAHKALSPVRFPPTVALTPVMAKWLGKDTEAEGGNTDSS